MVLELNKCFNIPATCLNKTIYVYIPYNPQFYIKMIDNSIAYDKEVKGNV